MFAVLDIIDDSIRSEANECRVEETHLGTLLCYDKNSMYFTKYGARIADELNMDFQTGEDRQRVSDVLPNVKSGVVDA